MSSQEKSKSSAVGQFQLDDRGQGRMCQIVCKPVLAMTDELEFSFTSTLYKMKQ